MPIFEYRCPVGHTHVINDRLDSILCGSDCSEIARRRFSFSIVHSIPEHFNNNTGTYVNNERQLRDQLKYQSDVESLATGLDHNYEYLSPADMTDLSSRGVTTDGLTDNALRKVESL
jgi:hypothetical protein